MLTIIVLATYIAHRPLTRKQKKNRHKKCCIIPHMGKHVIGIKKANNQLVKVVFKGTGISFLLKPVIRNKQPPLNTQIGCTNKN
jgi:hypothetical protein